MISKGFDEVKLKMPWPSPAILAVPASLGLGIMSGGGK
jgi:hypothetical protein